jgi:hypothetical protein
MAYLGYQIEVQPLLQLVTTTAIIGLYAMRTSLREQKASHLSDCQMVLMVSYLFNHHATVKDLKALTEAPESAIAKQGGKLWFFAARLEKFRRAAELPDVKLAAATSVLEHVLLIVLAPVFGIALPLFALYEGRHNTARIMHTEIRQNYFSKAVIVVAANLLFMAAAALLVIPSRPMLGGAIIIFAGIGGTGAMIHLSLLVSQQQAWKGYWADRLLEIRASAERDHNHDLYNGALILASHIESQPDVPVPGHLAYYAAVYSGIQAVILFGVKLLKL